MNRATKHEKILGLDVNIRVCFMSALEVNIQPLREVYPNVSLDVLSKSQCQWTV